VKGDDTMTTNKGTTTIGKPPPTLARLRELLVFEPGIGLMWRVPRGSAAAGRRAGGHHHTGIERIGIDGLSFRRDAIADLYRSAGSKRRATNLEQRQ
jgi:hypothetical protein